MSSSVRIETHDLDDELRKCIELAKSVSNRALLYVDYAAERYPYVTATLVDPDNGAPYMQITFRIDTQGRDAIVSLRARCSHGWIVYGYGPVTSREGVTHAARGWYHARGMILRPLNVVKELEEHLMNAATTVMDIARMRLVEEGYL